MSISSTLSETTSAADFLLASSVRIHADIVSGSASEVL